MGSKFGDFDRLNRIRNIKQQKGESKADGLQNAALIEARPETPKAIRDMLLLMNKKGKWKPTYGSGAGFVELITADKDDPEKPLDEEQLSTFATGFSRLVIIARSRRDLSGVEMRDLHTEEGKGKWQATRQRCSIPLQAYIDLCMEYSIKPAAPLKRKWASYLKSQEMQSGPGV